MSNPLNSQLKDAFTNSHKVVVLSHIRPDGDSIGAMLGLAFALEAAGKTVQRLNADGVPSVFRHLPGADQIRKKLDGDFDLVVSLDCSDLLRTGGILGETQIDINIDHHITNPHFARINYVDPEAVATSAILAEHLGDWGLQINQNAAITLLSGIVSDTIGFRTPNVTPHTLRLAADLMENGINLSDIYSRALVRRPVEAARYWGRGLTALKQEGRMVWTALTLNDRSEVGYPGNDDADLNNVISNLDGIDISVLFVEQRASHWKISWRAQQGIDVAALAQSFGGGGHPPAAGAEMDGSFEEVTTKVLPATRALLEKAIDNERVKSETRKE
jgi:phosphoesterase RecJ-like protein